MRPLAVTTPSSLRGPSQLNHLGVAMVAPPLVEEEETIQEEAELDLRDRTMVTQTRALTLLLARLEAQGGDQGASAGSSGPANGAAQRERLSRTLSDSPGAIGRTIMDNMARKLGPLHTNAGVPDPLAYLERFGNYGGQRGLGHVSWLTAHAFRAALLGETETVFDLLGLLLMATDQVALDSGRWELAWMMTMLDDPPQEMMGRQPPTSGAARAFTPLASQAWTSIALSYLKEMDTITARREELSHGPGRRQRDPHPKPPLKADPKGGKSKGDGKGGDKGDKNQH